MNEQEIKNILNDLYILDPGLRSREKEIVAIIKALAVKPDANFDPSFAADLRARLLSELALRKNTQNIFTAFMSNSMRFAVAGAAVVVVAIAAVAFLSVNKPSSGPVALLPSGANITRVGDNAFGNLNTLGAGANASADSAASASREGQGTSAPMAPKSAAAPMMMAPAGSGSTGAGSSASAGTGIASPSIAPVYPGYYQNYGYSYAGDPIHQTEQKLDVLKKSSAPISAGQAAAAIAQAGFGSLDLSSFGNANISNVTLSQDQDFGYSLYIDFANGSISINQNYQKWPQGNLQPLTASDIPSDDAVIAIANQFLGDHKIPTANYGTPEVTASYAIPMMKAAESVPTAGGSGTAGNAAMRPYYPDSIQVLYPLKVNGRLVYSSNGSKIGMTVEVNVRHKRVANVYGIAQSTYQASAYDAITDSAAIVKMAENPPFYPIIYYGMDATSGMQKGSTVTYKLDTPEMAYVDMYQYDNATGASSEYLVPAYVFPVEAPDTFYTKNIVVPLIKDFVQDNNPTRILPAEPPVPLNAPTAAPAPNQ